MPLQVTLFSPPNAKQTVFQMTEISDEDATWFYENKILVSVEELRNGAKVVYGKYGPEEGQECLVVSRTESCKKMMSDLRKRVAWELSRA